MQASWWNPSDLPPSHSAPAFSPNPGHRLNDLLVRRADILALLSDDEVAQVSLAETGARLADGDEFVDLSRPDHGVQAAHGDLVMMARVLPKTAVRMQTWAGVVAVLGRPPKGGPSAG